MTAEAMLKILKDYGIDSKEELYAEIHNFEGVDIGLFVGKREEAELN